MYYFRIELNAAAFRLAAFQLRQLRYLIWYELLQQAFDITNEVIDDSYLSPSEIIGISNRLRQLQQTKRCIYDKRVRNIIT